MIITIVPWVLAMVTACWFGLMAVKARRNWKLWTVAGGVFALVTSTFIFGLCQAVAIPFSNHDLAVLHAKWTVVSVVVIGALGWLLTCGLHRQHLILWAKFYSASAASAPNPASVQSPPAAQEGKSPKPGGPRPPGPRTDAGKQPAGR